jgi:hypothetical protein
MRICCTILVLLFVVIPGATSAQECSEALPKVIQHPEPSYPPIARTAHVTGEVRLKITTDGDSVSAAETEEGPHCFARLQRTMPRPGNLFRTSQTVFM